MSEDGVYTNVNRNLVRVTQAIEESEEEASFLLFDKLYTKKLRPIDEACIRCNSSTKEHFKHVKECQAYQAEDAKRRGFAQVICPRQFIEEDDEAWTMI